MNPTVEMLVRPEQAWAMIGIKKTKFYELAKKDAEFPKLIKKGRSTFLYLSEVQAYLKNTTEEKNNEIRFIFADGFLSCSWRVDR